MNTMTEIWVDQETDVQYLFHQDGYAGGLTPLLDQNGNPILFRSAPFAEKE